ncbi:CNNM domain-containing protein [uncultured Arcobacter sp.]|uniref:CNNM domain-containing protein n=1 Tax=uncultured Arcobacter sp. TaxID=165434 RepID=UPI00262C99C3|nr:CNNM domain-containing protein [uncultured Arcobacter sp.]
MLIFIYFSIAVGVSFVCSILEAVLLSITASHIEVVKSKNEKLGNLMFNQKEQINISIGAILTLNTFAHTLGAAGVGSEAVKLFGEEFMFYISAVLTILILVFSEIIPKTLGANYWKSLSGVSTHVISWLVFITYPLVVTMNKITIFISKDDKGSISREEVAAAASIAQANGALKDSESDMIENLLNLDEIKVEEIHTPRSVMVSLSKEELLNSFDKKNSTINFEKIKAYSRIPIYEGEIDNIIGLIISKEYFYEYISNNLENKEDIIKPVYKINENIPISKLLNLFLSRNEHLFIVTDNYEQTKGVVTLEDAIETLLGVEIVDELDHEVDLREVAKVKMKLLRKKILQQQNH